MSSLFEIAEKHFEEKDVQTLLKHVLLKNYMINWANVFGKAAIGLDISEIHFVDCFAGRGIFKDGSEGSPQLAVDNLFELQNTFNRYKDNACTFQISLIEILKEYQYLLEKNLRMDPKYRKQMSIMKGEFRTKLPSMLARTEGHPALYFIDPFGYKGVHMTDVVDILQQQGNEVLINAMSYSLVRNITIEKNSKELCNFFGIDKLDTNLEDYVLSAAKEDNLSDKNIMKLEDKIIALYKQQVRKKSKKKVYLLSKRIYSPIKQSIYFHLIYMTGHRKGLIKMKDSMVKFDEEKTMVEERYIEKYGDKDHSISFTNDLFSEEQLLSQYSYEDFVKEFQHYFHSGETTYGKVIDHFLQYSPLPFKKKNSSCIYEFMKKLSKEDTGLEFTNKEFSNDRVADKLIIKNKGSKFTTQIPLF